MVSPIQDVLEVFFLPGRTQAPRWLGLFYIVRTGIFFLMYGILRDADALELTLLLKGMKAALLDVSRMACDF